MESGDVFILTSLSNCAFCHLFFFPKVAIIRLKTLFSLSHHFSEHLLFFVENCLKDGFQSHFFEGYLAFGYLIYILYNFTQCISDFYYSFVFFYESSNSKLREMVILLWTCKFLYILHPAFLLLSIVLLLYYAWHSHQNLDLNTDNYTLH